VRGMNSGWCPGEPGFASQLSPTVLTAKPGGGKLRIADGVEMFVEILHVTSSHIKSLGPPRESSSGLADVLVFSSDAPVVGRR
jgi:hypothetical protein